MTTPSKALVWTTAVGLVVAVGLTLWPSTEEPGDSETAATTPNVPATTSCPAGASRGQLAPARLEPVDASAVFEGTDVIAEVTALKLFACDERDHGVREYFEGEIVRILYLSEDAAMQGTDPEVPYVVPTLAEEDRLVLASLRDHGVESAHQFQGARGSVLVGATYLPDHRLNGHITNWFVDYIAVENADGTWTFLNASGDWLRSQLDLLQASVGEGQNHTELIVTWAEQAEAHRAGGPAPGYSDRLLDAGAAARENNKFASWYSLLPDERALDAELTPPEVLETLVTIQLLVDIESAPQLEDRFLVVKSDTGVVHSTVLAAGNHPIHVLAEPGDDLRVVVTNRPVGGTDDLVSTVAATDWHPARTDVNTHAVLIRYAGPGDGEARIVDKPTADALLATW